jgi:hypothetical protein
MKTLIIKYWWVLLLVLILSVGIIWLSVSFRTLKKESTLKDIKLSVLQDTVSVFRSRNGDLTFQLSAVNVQLASITLTSAYLKNSLEEAGWNVNQLKQRNIEWKKTVDALQAKIDAFGSGTITLHDTIYAGSKETFKVGDWSDRFLTLHPKISGNEMQFTYGYQTGIDFITTRSKKATIVSVYLTDPVDKSKGNPNASITSANSLSFVDKPPWWGWKYIEFGGGLVLGYFLFK